MGPVDPATVCLLSRDGTHGNGTEGGSGARVKPDVTGEALTS